MRYLAIIAILAAMAAAIPAHALITGAVRVLVPDGQILLVSNGPDTPWYTDPRLNGYNLFTYDPGQRLYVVYGTDAYYYRSHHLPIPPHARGHHWRWHVMPQARSRRHATFYPAAWVTEDPAPAFRPMPNWQRRYYGHRHANHGDPRHARGASWHPYQRLADDHPSNHDHHQTWHHGRHQGRQVGIRPHAFHHGQR